MLDSFVQTQICLGSRPRGSLPLLDSQPFSSLLRLVMFHRSISFGIGTFIELVGISRDSLAGLLFEGTSMADHTVRSM
jgi:hypothetical protein